MCVWGTAADAGGPCRWMRPCGDQKRGGRAYSLRRGAAETERTDTLVRRSSREPDALLCFLGHRVQSTSTLAPRRICLIPLHFTAQPSKLRACIAWPSIFLHPKKKAAHTTRVGLLWCEIISPRAVLLLCQSSAETKRRRVRSG